MTTIPVETTLGREGTGQASHVWLEMVKGAEKTLDFARFYLSNKKGEPLEPIIQAIIKAAGRGVKFQIRLSNLMNHGRNGILTGRNVVPTGRFSISTGRNAVPTGRFIISTGRFVISTG